MEFILIFLLFLSANAWADGVDSMIWVILAGVIYIVTLLILDNYSKMTARFRKE